MNAWRPVDSIRYHAWSVCRRARCWWLGGHLMRPWRQVVLGHEFRVCERCPHLETRRYSNVAVDEESARRLYNAVADRLRSP